MTVFSGCVCWPSHKEAAQLIRPEQFLHLIGPTPTDTSAGLTSFCFIAACISCFKCVGHSTRRTPCLPHEPKRHLILWTIKQTMNTHQEFYVDGTAIILTAHQWPQNFSACLGADGRHKITSKCLVALMWVTAGSLLKWSETTSTGNDGNHGTPQEYLLLKWYISLSKPSSSSFRLRSWLLLAKGTGALPARETKRRVTTARRRLNWLRVSASVRTSSQPEEVVVASLTPLKDQIYATDPNIAKTIWNSIKNLMQNPWEDTLQGWVLHRRMWHAQHQIQFWNHLEQQWMHLQDDPQAPGKLQTLKHNSSMMPSSCLGARWVLA